MGCHTWTYKRYEACTLAQKKKFLDECNETLKTVFEPFEEFSKFCKECSKIYMEGYSKDSKQYNYWKKFGEDENIKKSYEKRLNKYKEFQDGITEDNMLAFCKIGNESASFNIIRGKLYLEDKFDYPFRVYGYPEETFTNKGKLLKWLSGKNANEIGYYDENNNYKWIPGYTKELVNRINNYFINSGENNLYIEFG